MGSKFSTSTDFIETAKEWNTANTVRAGVVDYYLENSLSCGAFGSAFEVLSAYANSKKTGVSKQNEKDNNIKIKADNKRGYNFKACEFKTNGGRLTDCIEKLNRGTDSLIVYTLSLEIQNKKGIAVRYFPPYLMRFSDFFRILTECGALKEMRHGGKVDGIGIQVTSKKLYSALWDFASENGGAWYIPNTIFNI